MDPAAYSSPDASLALEGMLVDLEDGTALGVVNEVVVEGGTAVGLDVACGWFGRRHRWVELADVIEVRTLDGVVVVRADADVAWSRHGRR